MGKHLIDNHMGIVNRGNWCRIKQVMRKALRGEPITIGFLGGSITQGCNSSIPETCYAYRVYKWWKEKFPNSDITYVNAGIGGTTSQFGVARVDDDLLSKNIDFTTVEFSVNDDANDHFKETWGDSIYIDTIAEHLPYGKHKVEIEIITTHEDDKVPFYLVSVIGSC